MPLRKHLFQSLSTSFVQGPEGLPQRPAAHFRFPQVSSRWKSISGLTSRNMDSELRNHPFKRSTLLDFFEHRWVKVSNGYTVIPLKFVMRKIH
jgi:hypothetical protein